MNKFSFINLNVSNNSNVSFSLIKSEDLVNFCVKNKIKTASSCDYNQNDFINFYFLCKKNKISPIWGIKKELSFEEKPYFVSFFPKSYSNYKFLNNFFFKNRIDKKIQIKDISKELFDKSLFVIESRSIFDLNSSYFLKKYLVKNLGKEVFQSIYFGISFVPKKNRSIFFDENKLEKNFLIFFYSIKFLDSRDNIFLNKLRLLGDLKSFENNDLNQNYFHYLSDQDFYEMTENEETLLIIKNNLIKFTSQIKIFIKSKKENENNFEFSKLKSICYEKLEGIKETLKKSNEYYEYKNILEKELFVINSKNYSSYFNKLYFIMKIFSENDIEVGPGRGSSVSSLVSYLMGITQINPIKNNLFFWRFLNEKRFDFPDVDIDVNDQKKAIEKISESFGKNSVSKVSVRKKISLLFLVKNSTKHFNIREEDENFIVENIERFSKIISKEIIIKENENLSFKDIKIKKIFDENTFYHEFLERSGNLNVSYNSHPSGLVIEDKKDLTKIIPVYKDSEGFLVTHYPSKSLESIGFKKFDFLSLTESLNFISFMKKKFPNIPSYREASLVDSKTWNMLENGLVSCVFQLDSKISRFLVNKIKLKKFDDLVLIISLNRPGASSNSKLIIQNKNSEDKKKEFSCSYINNLLLPTHGHIIFEEQISLLLSFCLSIDIYEAENIRRELKSIFQKKEEFSDFKKNFFEKSIKSISYEDKVNIFKKISLSVPYMFNKSHALSYSYLSYYVSYIKANYFDDSISYFMSKYPMNNEKLFFLFSELFIKNYEIIKPEINSSFWNVIFSKRKVFLGFSCFSNFDYKIFKLLEEERSKNGKFVNFRDFLDRNIKILGDNSFDKFVPWIKSGLFRSLDFKTSQIKENFQFFSRYIKLKKNFFIEDNSLPFIENSKESFIDSNSKSSNEEDLSSFCCYLSYFDRWKKVSLVKKNEIITFQKFTEEQPERRYFLPKILKTYSILKSITKKRRGFVLTIFDVNSIFDVFIERESFEKAKDFIAINKEFIFTFEFLQERLAEYLIKVKDLKEIKVY